MFSLIVIILLLIIKSQSKAEDKLNLCSNLTDCKSCLIPQYNCFWCGFCEEKKITKVCIIY